VTSNNAKTQSWVTKTVWQRIPGRRARKEPERTPKNRDQQEFEGSEA